jgi:hypothetical protein
MIDVATSPDSCGDSRDVVVAAIGRHRARLNGEFDVTITDVGQRLHEVMSYRAEKVIYMKAAPDVSWGDFLELVDEVWPEADVVSILTSQVES